MKLYATTTSERASKGQGGNDYLHIDIINENRQPLATIDIVAGVLGVIHKPVYEMAIRNWIDGTEKKTIIEREPKGKQKKGDSDDIRYKLDRECRY